MIKNPFQNHFPLSVKQLIILLVFIYLAALVVFFIPHKKVSQSFQEEFAQISFLSETTGPERVAYISDNMDALLYRLRMIEEAKEEIILSTFDFNCDDSGQDIMAALLHAAERGVRVRIVVDGFSGLLDMTGNPYFQALASHENIEIKQYNPITPLKPWTIQARLHDKYLIIDHSMYLLGGRNTMNLFLGDYSDVKNSDRELFLYAQTPSENTSLEALRSYFERVWLSSDTKSFLCKNPSRKVTEKYQELTDRYQELTASYPSILKVWDWNALTMETGKVTLLTNPIEAANKEPHMWHALSELMKKGKDIKIYTPYIICGKEMYRDLEEICSKADSVEILTNDVASGANPWGCTDYLNQKKRIWATGARVYEFLNTTSSHTKAYLIDDRLSIVGSYNLDMRSTYLDTELMLVVDCPDLNAIIQEEFERDKTYSRTMTSTGEYAVGENYHAKEVPPLKKGFYAILRVLIIPLRRFL